MNNAREKAPESRVYADSREEKGPESRVYADSQEDRSRSGNPEPWANTFGYLLCNQLIQKC